MIITRRALMQSTLAGGAVLAAPWSLRAQNKQTVRMIMQDLQIFDPVFTTADVVQIHGLAIYDTLFSVDADLRPQPQMVGNWDLSDDKKTYKFELRDGLHWHDGTVVTAKDCVASIRRWGEAVAPGKLLLERAVAVEATDDKAFTITLKEPFALVLDILASPGQPLFMMREQDAKLAATEQVKTNIGSGPFKYNAGLTRPGSRVVYDRNEKYVPRDEPANGFAGGKVVKVNQIIWENITDAQTALAALQAGEVDFWWLPVADLYPAIKSDPHLALDTMGKNGVDWVVRLNYLQPPFDNIKMRQALLHLIDQTAFLSVLAPDRAFGRTVTSMFGSGSPYTNDVSTDWFKEGGNLERAKQLIAESGYSGEKVVILDPTDWPECELASQLLANVMQKAGINAELAPMTWSELAVRRGKKEPVEDGGWSIFITTTTDFSMRDPLTWSIFVMDGDNGWYGWPKNDEYEALRAKWPDIETLEERKELAREMQRIWWDYVGVVYLCQTLAPAARRTSLVDMINSPSSEVIMWNMHESQA
ncbi:ABC transporter substrate-binding protein [Rhizobium sp. 1AS13]|uniref:ABC transporter substrate-binding protein n=1 Tax=Rhizobium acaciae TaxID=2989736 RepID=UPI0022220A99|nr:ABC transporter substrate-binding protein [Rhizobium acaciae]MCW1413831.1 ABC transporter substrate-binding protein [Rhizobium acaciae]